MPDGSVLTGLASYGQQQLWLAEQAEPGTAVNNNAIAWDLHGPLDVSALRGSVDMLMSRHEALRTVLRQERDELWQHVLPARPARFVQLQVGNLAAARAHMDHWTAVPFDLAAEPATRAVLIRIAPDDHHLFLLVVHHAMSDGESFAIIRRELVSAYTALASGATPDLPPPGASYLEFAAKERADGAAQAKAACRWLAELRDTAASRGAPAGTMHRRLVGRVRSRSIDLPRGDLGQLLDRAADEAVTPAMALGALFGVLLSRWTGEPCVMFSSPVSLRHDPRFQTSVGFFVNSMPMLLDVVGNPTVDQLFDRGRAAVLAAIEHAHVMPAHIQEAVAGGVPGLDLLHRVTFAVEGAVPARFTMAGVTVVERQLSRTHTMFGISVRIVLDADRPHIVLEHDGDAISGSTAERLGSHLRELVGAAAHARRETDLPRVPNSDWVRLIRWSRGSVQQPAAGLLESVAGWVRDRPDQAAVRTGDRMLTYRQLWDQALRCAGSLRDLAVGPESVVAICLPRSAALLVSIIGTLSCGAAFMPLDPRDAPTRRRQQLTAAGAAVLIITDPSDAPGWDGPVLLADRIGAAPWPDRIAPETIRPDALAYIINTSGSTGAPKGVMVTHRGLVNYLRWATATYGIGPGTTVPLHTSAAFDLAFTSLLGPLYAGATAHMLPEEEGPLAVVQQSVGPYQMVKATPSLLLAMLEASDDRVGGIARVLVSGGENLHAELAARWRARASRTSLVNEYGPTETVVGSTAYTVPTRVEGGLTPIGRPIDNTTVWVVDTELQPVPIGAPGELVIGGVGVARGYRNTPGLTADRFVPDPFDRTGGGRLYRTGDIARWKPDGDLELIGRLDDQVKILGYRVEPGEIEAALARCPGVRHAAVVVDQAADRARMVAFLAPDAPAAGPLAERVRAWLRRRLPPHMVPELFVTMDQLPTNGNGKIDRAALVVPRAHAAAEASPPPTGTWLETVYAAFCEVLEREQVSVDQSFFEAGGNSLLLLRLERALRARGVTVLSVTDLFRFPTVAELAARIQTLAAAPGRAAGDGTTPGVPTLAPRHRLHRVRSAHES